MSDNTPTLKWSDPGTAAMSDRRAESRESTPTQVTLTAPGESTRQLVSRDRSFGGLSFTSAEPMRLGQDCHLTLENADGSIARFVARVVRHRTLADGQYEIALQFRRQIAA